MSMSSHMAKIPQYGSPFEITNAQFRVQIVVLFLGRPIHTWLLKCFACLLSCLFTQLRKISSEFVLISVITRNELIQACLLIVGL